jgi:hypothetical protein
MSGKLRHARPGPDAAARIPARYGFITRDTGQGKRDQPFLPGSVTKNKLKRADSIGGDSG